MGRNRQPRLNRARTPLLWIVLVACAGERAEEPVGQEAAAGSTWHLDSTYSEMDRDWNFLAVGTLVSQDGDSLVVVGMCSIEARTRGPAVFVEPRGGLTRTYRDGQDLVDVRVRRGEDLKAEEWHWIRGTGSPLGLEGTAFLRSLSPPGIWLELPTERRGRLLYKLGDPTADSVATWLEQRCPGKR